MKAITTYDAAAQVGLSIGSRTGDYLDRREIVDTTTGEVLADRATQGQAWDLIRQRQQVAS